MMSRDAAGRMKAHAAATALFCFGLASIAASSQPARSREGLTAIPGIKVGQHTLTERPTGCDEAAIDASPKQKSAVAAA